MKLLEKGDLVQVKAMYYPHRDEFGIVVGLVGGNRLQPYTAQILWPDNRIENTLAGFVTRINSYRK